MFGFGYTDIKEEFKVISMAFITNLQRDSDILRQCV